MTTLQRLLFVLLALALLPGAQARVAMPVQTGGVAPAVTADAGPGGCHEAPGLAPGAHASPHHAGTGAGDVSPATPAMECCPGDDGGASSCGGACACPPGVSGALLHASTAGSAAHGGECWQRHGHARRPGPPGSPPKRPPIG